jgi:hypothetical protein
MGCLTYLQERTKQLAEAQGGAERQAKTVDGTEKQGRCIDDE